MDQRNTGTSFAPVTAADGWDDYAADQLGLMDHLGIDRFAVVGMCIGGAFIAKLLVDAPDRVTAAVAMQPIGLDANQDTFDELFATWRDDVRADHPEASDADWAAVQRQPVRPRRLRVERARRRRGDDRRAAPRPARQRPVPPRVDLRAPGRRRPGARLIQTWKDGEAVHSARAEVDAFLDANA